MGLPDINIQFKSLAGKAIQRSQRGIVALLIKDTLATSQIIKGIEDIPTLSNMEQQNIDYIKQVLQGGCSKVIVEVIEEEPLGTFLLGESLTRLKVQYWNYLAMPEASTEDISSIVTFIKNSRDVNKKSFKAVVSTSVAPDHEGIINFKSTGLKIKETGATPTAQEFTGRIAGILAGLPFTRSATYFVIPEVEAVDLISDQDSAIDAGQLILISDGDNVKIASGVNSLTSTNSSKPEIMKDILIVEKIDLIRDDITKVYNDQYVGKVINTYNNKQLLVTNIHSYFQTLIRDYEFFDRNEVNELFVDPSANKLYLESQGVDTSKMDEMALKQANTGKKVFLSGSVRFTNTMSDLSIELSM